MTNAREIDGRACLLIAASTIGVSVSVIPVSILSLGVFMKPLGDAFGWGRGEIALSLSLLSLAMAAAMPLSGRLIDSFGVRRPLIISLVLYGVSVVLLPTIISKFGLAGLYGWAVWAGVVGSPSSSVAYVKVLTAWFDRSRGVALGFAMSGVALGGAIAPLIAATLIEDFGWQAGFRGLAFLPIAIGIPVALYMRERPSTHTTAGGETEARPAPDGLSVAEAVRTRAFWMLFLLFLVAATAIHGIQIHLAPLLSDRGLDPSSAALGVTFMFGISVGVRLLAGYLFDRVFAPWVGAACFLAAAIGSALLISEGTTTVYLIGVALLGIGAGAESDLLGYLVSRYFGLRAFGTIYGWIFAAFMAGSALGPFFLGVGFDASGSYATSLLWCSAGLFATAGLLMVLPRFPKWGEDAAAPAAAPPFAATAQS